MKCLAYSAYVLVLLVINTAALFAQQEEYAFNHYKSLGENNIVYFRIQNLYDDIEEQDNILETLLSDKLIYDGDIYTVEKENATCQLEINPSVSVSYIRTLIQSTGYDIDLTSISKKNPSKPQGIYSSERYTFFESFDGFKDYDPNKPGALSPEDHYANEKQKWIDENPEEYKKAKAQNGTSVIVKRKDFESFSAEKKERILSQPEVFIIED